MLDSVMEEQQLVVVYYYLMTIKIGANKNAIKFKPF